MLLIILWASLGLLVLGSLYLIWEGYKVYRLFTGSIVGNLVKTLVIVLLIELYSLGVASFAFINLVTNGVYILLPIVLLWTASLAYAIFAVRLAHKQVNVLIK
mgnify:CR=1 FL=1